MWDREKQKPFRGCDLCGLCGSELGCSHRCLGGVMRVNLWLDDVRPAPDGWLHVKTVDEAKAAFDEHEVYYASLDHDLGACAACLKGRSPEQWLAENNYKSMPHCEHFGTGYDLVCWMEENQIWPEQKPTVHSANPAGRARMQQVINKVWDA